MTQVINDQVDHSPEFDQEAGREGVFLLTGLKAHGKCQSGRRVIGRKPVHSRRRFWPRWWLLGVIAILLSLPPFPASRHLVLAAEGAATEVTRDPRWIQFTRDRDMFVSNDTRSIWVDAEALWIGG